jgi:hypothetical protein
VNFLKDATVSLQGSNVLKYSGNFNSSASSYRIKPSPLVDSVILDGGKEYKNQKEFDFSKNQSYTALCIRNSYGRPRVIVVENCSLD